MELRSPPLNERSGGALLNGKKQSAREAADAVVRAAVVVSAVVLFFSWPVAGSATNRDCPTPHQERAESGWTVDVGCDDSSPLLAPLQGPARLLFGQRLNLNLADEASLQVLPGITGHHPGN